MKIRIVHTVLSITVPANGMQRAKPSVRGNAETLVAGLKDICPMAAVARGSAPRDQVVLRARQ